MIMDGVQIVKASRCAGGEERIIPTVAMGLFLFSAISIIIG
jgi:hypothetical protein